METFDSNDALEIDCYEKILSFYNKQKEKDRDEVKLWKHKTVIKIMEIWNKTRNITLARNSLIILI